MSYLSGRRCLAASGSSEFASMFDWQLSMTNAVQTVVASNTSFYELKIPGNTDWTGSVGFYGALPPVFPGDTLTLKMYVDESANACWSGDAMCLGFTLDADIEGGGVLTGRMTFGGNGAIAPTTGTDSDSSAPPKMSCVGLGASWAGSNIALRRWSLNYTCDAKTYVDGASAGVVKRVAGNFKLAGSFEMYEGTPASVLNEGDTDELLLYTTNGQSPSDYYWRLKYVTLLSAAQAASRQSADVVGVQYPFEFSGYKVGSSTKGVLSYVGATTTTKFS